VSDGGPAPLAVALGEYDIGFEDPATSIARAGELVARARAAGARLVVLPETSTTGFTMDSSRWAEEMGGPDSTKLKSIARINGVWLVAGRAVRMPDGAARNVAMVINPEGELVGAYRKQRLFAFGGEDKAYAPGDGPIMVTIDGVRVCPFICYDLRFPELFRAVAKRVDLFLVIANWPAARRAHWDVLLRARAIENQAFVVGVNRTGEGGGLSYDGGSAAWSPWGEPLAATSSEPAIVHVDPSEVVRVRTKYPFLDDMRAL
jgi:omega-amidase